MIMIITEPQKKFTNTTEVFKFDDPYAVKETIYFNEKKTIIDLSKISDISIKKTYTKEKELSYICFVFGKDQYKISFNPFFGNTKEEALKLVKFLEELEIYLENVFDYLSEMKVFVNFKNLTLKEQGGKEGTIWN